MAHNTRLTVRPLLVMIALIAALLACTASLTGSDDDPNGSSGGGDSGDGRDGTVPSVRILEPVSGASVPANQRVDITVETDTTATSFLLNVGGRVAGSKALPPDQAGPSKAILSWTPTRQGTFTLEVIAFNGPTASVPASLIVTVSGTASGTSSGQVADGCTGRVLVSQLNYRGGPSTGSDKLGQFEVGETVTVIGRNANTSWYKVQRLNMQQVWTINNAQWIQVGGDCANVPEVG
ncbi:MAG: SH3 domain-containing protein [Chloroflexi bacterium]|nr:MAG: SH3 domain-containing protein [Chloroflexota bacterium]